jgi:hypothetical protein
LFVERSHCGGEPPAFVDFGPFHEYFLGCDDPEPHLIPSYHRHPDANVAVDHDYFARPASQN